MPSGNLVYRCLSDLYGRGEPLVRDNMAKILALTGDLFGTDKVKDNAKLQENMASLARSFYADTRPEFEAAVGQFPPETAQKLAGIVTG